MISQASSFPDCEGTCSRVSKLEQRVEELEGEKQELRKKLDYQKEKHARLWKKYRKLKNPHKPSSKKARWEKEEEKEKRRSKREKEKEEDEGREDKEKPGRKPEHEPAWREQPDPEEEIDVTQDRCDDCGNEVGGSIGVEHRIIEDIPKPEQPTVKQFNIHKYFCETCDKEVVAIHPDCPDEGDFGPNVQMQVTLFKYEQRLPHRKVSDLMDTLYRLKISHGTVFNLTERVSNCLRPLYEDVRENLRSAPVLHVDETGFTVGGKNWWLWSFSNGEEVLYALRDSRGSGVLEEILGENFDGWIVCDGWGSYPAFTKKLQRCWSHLLREVDDKAERHEEAAPLAEELHRIYDHLNEFLDRDPPPPEMEEKKDWAISAMRELTEREYEDEEVVKLIGKIENGMEHWFTFVVEPDVDPTNNRAENDLREPIVIRKIIGTLRNEKGTRIFETVMTMLATWKRQDLNPHEEMLKAVRT